MNREVLPNSYNILKFILDIRQLIKHMRITKTLAIVAALAMGLAAVSTAYTVQMVDAAITRN